MFYLDSRVKWPKLKLAKATHTVIRLRYPVVFVYGNLLVEDRLLSVLIGNIWNAEVSVLVLKYDRRLSYFSWNSSQWDGAVYRYYDVKRFSWNFM